MELRTSSPRKFTSPRRHAYERFANPCAQCGRTLFMPEWTEYLNERRARHVWECDACGYSFETLVCFPES